MDILRFEAACELVKKGGRLQKGIGTLGESSAHAVLKNYFEISHDSQEQKIGRFVADIVGENGIIEIQTSHFNALREKLQAFLPVSHVTVVFPVYINKRIVYFDENGCETRSRKSPLKGSVFNIFRELIYLTDLMKDKNLSFKIMILDCDEYRISPLALGKAKNKNDNFSVFDRFPTRLRNEITISDTDDWSQIIPCLREHNFTVSDVSELTHSPRKVVSIALAVLYKAGILIRTGKKSRSFTYSYYKDIEQ